MGRLHNHSEQNAHRRSLRNDPTPSEQKLWSVLKGRGLEGYKFRRQHGVGHYIVDFYCPELHLAIEIDGDSHFQPAAERYDKKRDEDIRSQGVHILRFTNLDVKLNLDGVIDAILERLAELSS